MKKILFYFLFPFTLLAHPHTFIDVYPTIKVTNNKAKIINFKWKIDDMTSTMLLMDVDTDGNGKIDAKENEFIKNNYFTIFEDYHFYTFIKMNGKTIPFPKTSNFKATIENHRVCYSFDIKGDFNMKQMVIEVGDTDFYVAMVIKQEFLNISGINAFVTGVDNDFYYGYKVEFK